MSRLLVRQKMTDVLCSTFFSLLWRAQARGEAQYQSCPSSNRASTYLSRPNKPPGSACSIWPFYQQKQDGIVACVCWFCMIMPSCLLFLVDEEKKRLVKSENDSFGKWSWLNGPSIHGAQQKSRRCFPKEATMLKGSSQYTLRYHLIALCKEPHKTASL